MVTQLNGGFSGMGYFTTETDDGSAIKLFPARPMGFSLEPNTESNNSQRWEDGKRVTAATFLTTEEWTLTLNFQEITRAVFGMAVGERPATTASIKIPITKYATIPTTAPYTITNTAIEDGDDVYVSDVTGKAFSMQSASADVSTTYEAHASDAGVLTFNSTEAGQVICYRYLVSFTNVQTLGVESAYEAISKVGFTGVAYGNVDVAVIQIPSMAQASKSTISFDDVSEFELSYNLSVATGERSYFKVTFIPKAEFLAAL